jgi:uncharacterized protein (TIGR03435 family)
MSVRTLQHLVRLTYDAVSSSRLCSGQNAPAFEVASIKRSPDAPFSFPGLMLQPGGRATTPGTNVRQLVLVAYGLQDLQLVADRRGWRASSTPSRRAPAPAPRERAYG